MEVIHEYGWRKTLSLLALLRCVRERNLSRCERQLRFFALNCCRLAWPALTEERSRRAVDIAERYLVGLATRNEYNEALLEANAARHEAQGQQQLLYADRSRHADHAARALHMSASLAGRLAFQVAANGFYDGLIAQVRDALAFRGVVHARSGVGALKGEMCRVLREVVGNPFRPVAFSPEWRTDTAVALARGMYESREFSAMPILADALQDAGCGSDDLLDHCRNEGTHVRGCWVVDFLLADQ